MAKKKAPLFDAAEFLDNPQIIASYLSEALKTGDIRLIAKAIGTVARAEGMTGVAQASGLDRVHLYRALSTGGHPEFETVIRVLKVFGVRLVATVQHPQPSETLPQLRVSKTASRRAVLQIGGC